MRAATRSRTGGRRMGAPHATTLALDCSGNASSPEASRMSADETRVTNFKQVNARLQVGTEACLVQIAGPELGKKYVVEGPELTIGRDDNNDIVVDLDNVS